MKSEEEREKKRVVFCSSGKPAPLRFESMGCQEESMGDCGTQMLWNFPDFLPNQMKWVPYKIKTETQSELLDISIATWKMNLEEAM